MDQDFWLNKWQQGQTGFHQPEGQSLLHEYWPQLELPPSSNILVPLCGKSRDMLWLANQGHHVTGIELSDIAAQEFFAEAKLDYQRAQLEYFDCFKSTRIEIRVGNIFDMPANELMRFDGFYDRAALIALPKELRQRYVDHLMAGLPSGAIGLLIAFSYDPALMSGPPFSVNDEMVGHLYSRFAHVDLLAERRGLDSDSSLRKRGLTDKDTRESVYRIVRR